MTLFNAIRFFQLPDNGGGGDSLITSGQLTEEGGDATLQAAAGQDDPGNSNAGSADPFGDLKEFQDENGKYLGKYNTPRDVFEGYKNATAKLRERFPEPPETPEKYEFSFQDEALKELDLKEDPAWQAMAPIFHGAKVSNEAAQAIVENYLKFQASNQVKPEQIREGLGGEADKIVNEVQAFVNKSNDPQGIGLLGAVAGQSAATLKAFHGLLQQLGEKAIPASAGVQTGKTSQELEDEAFEYKQKHSATIDSNPAQQKVYEALLLKAINSKK